MNDPITVEIDGVDYNLVRVDESDQAAFGSRFGSGGVDESDLTLLKTISYKAVEMGSFTTDDVSLAPYFVSGRADYSNKTLSPYFQPVDIDTSAFTDLYNVSLPGLVYELTARCYYKGSTYLAFRGNNKNYIFKYEAYSQTLTAHSTATALRDDAYKINSFAESNGYLYCTTALGTKLWYTNGTTSWAQSGATFGTANFKQIFNLNEQMYGVGTTGAIYQFTGTTASSTSTLICNISQKYLESIREFYPIDVLNGRAYIATPKGLYGFDGVRSYEVVKSEVYTDLEVFNFCVASAGYIYFNKGYIVFRFNGASIERLYEFPRDTYFTDAFAIDDDIYIQTAAKTADEIGRKFDPAVSEDYDNVFRVYKYDGVNMHHSLTFTRSVGSKGAWSLGIAASTDGLLVFAGEPSTSSFASLQYLYEYSMPDLTEFDTVDTYDGQIDVIFNKEDMDLPSVPKIPHSCQFNFLNDVNITSGTLKVYYRVNESDAWALCKTFTGNAAEYRGDFDVTMPASKRFYWRLELDGSNIQWESWQVYYLIQDPYRQQWNLVLNPAANTISEPTEYTATYLSNLRTLRETQEVFTFVDVDGTSHQAILDSYTFTVMPTYLPEAGQPFEAQITVVLKEV